MLVEKKTYIKSLEDYNYSSVIFYIENCYNEFVAQCKKEKLGHAYLFKEKEYCYFWYITNMDVDWVQMLFDIDLQYPVTILELFADKDGLYYIEHKEV